MHRHGLVGQRAIHVEIRVLFKLQNSSEFGPLAVQHVNKVIIRNDDTNDSHDFAHFIALGTENGLVNSHKPTKQNCGVNVREGANLAHG